MPHDKNKNDAKVRIEQAANDQALDTKHFEKIKLSARYEKLVHRFEKTIFGKLTDFYEDHLEKVKKDVELGVELSEHNEVFKTAVKPLNKAFELIPEPTRHWIKGFMTILNTGFEFIVSLAQTAVKIAYSIPVETFKIAEDLFLISKGEKEIDHLPAGLSLSLRIAKWAGLVSGVGLGGTSLFSSAMGLLGYSVAYKSTFLIGTLFAAGTPLIPAVVLLGACTSSFAKLVNTVRSAIGWARAKDIHEKQNLKSEFFSNLSGLLISTATAILCFVFLANPLALFITVGAALILGAVSKPILGKIFPKAKKDKKISGGEEAENLNEENNNDVDNVLENNNKNEIPTPKNQQDVQENAPKNSELPAINIEPIIPQMNIVTDVQETSKDINPKIPHVPYEGVPKDIEPLSIAHLFEEAENLNEENNNDVDNVLENNNKNEIPTPKNQQDVQENAPKNSELPAINIEPIIPQMNIVTDVQETSKDINPKIPHVPYEGVRKDIEPLSSITHLFEEAENLNEENNNDVDNILENNNKNEIPTPKNQQDVQENAPKNSELPAINIEPIIPQMNIAAKEALQDIKPLSSIAHLFKELLERHEPKNIEPKIPQMKIAAKEAPKDIEPKILHVQDEKEDEGDGEREGDGKPEAPDHPQEDSQSDPKDDGDGDNDNEGKVSERALTI